MSGFPETTASVIRVGLLHLAPLTGELDHNRRQIETAIELAAAAGADWIITPELAACGYAFADMIGTEWIAPQPDPWMTGLCRKTAELGVTLFLSYPERDAGSDRLFNTVFVLANGRVVGSHRKINALRSGSEAWSSPGTKAEPIKVPPSIKVGILICGDAFSPGITASLHARGAQFLVSSAAWAPGFHGPNGEWERCSSATGLPLLVCNRTGTDRFLDFRDAESVIIRQGRRLLSFRSPCSKVILIDWDLVNQALVSDYQQILPL